MGADHTPTTQLLTSVFREAVRHYPPLKFAYGIIGITAAAGISLALVPNTRLVVVLPLCLAMMILLVLFSSIAARDPPSMQGPARFLLWSTTIAFVVAIGLAVSAIAFGLPEPLHAFLLGESVPVKQVATKIGAVSVSGTVTSIKIVPSDFVDTYAIAGKNQIVERHIPPAKGYKWDTSVQPKIMSQPTGEQGRCLSATIITDEDLVITAKIGHIFKPFGPDKPGHVSCQVRTRRLRFETEVQAFALPSQDLLPKRPLRFALPIHVATFRVLIDDGSGATDLLTLDNPNGRLATMTKQGNTLIVTPAG